MKAVRPRKYYDFEREMREKVSPQKVRDEVSTQLLCGENVPGTTVSLDRERERERERTDKHRVAGTFHRLWTNVPGTHRSSGDIRSVPATTFV